MSPALVFRQLQRKSAGNFSVAVLPIVIAAALVSPAQQARSQRASSDNNSDPRVVAAEKLLSEGRVQDAKQTLEEEIREKPNVAAYNLLGIACISEKNFPDALDAFDHALKIDPNSVKTHNNLANFYIAQGKAELAEKELK